MAFILTHAGHARSSRGRTPRSPLRGDVRIPSALPILLLIFFISGSALSQPAWETVAGGPAIEHSPLCVTVIDSLYAVVGGWGGRIFRTTDGGDHWMTSPSGTTDNFETISFSDRYHGTVIGVTGSTILRTEDGGETWRRQTQTLFDSLYTLGGVSFSDSLNGVLTTVDANRIYHTSDGGDRWVPVTSLLFRSIRRIRLRDSYGMAVGNEGDTYRTTDGGLSWYFHSALTGGKDLRDVYIRDSLSAIAVGNDGTIRRTTDGGIFWSEIPSGTNIHFQSIAFSDAMHGIIGTDGGMVLRTADGGLSWSEPEPTPMNTVWDLAFASPSFGLAVTRFNGRIFRTTDAGVGWESLEYSWRGSYSGVFPLNADSLFCVGEGGRIAFSADYGRSWTPQSSPVTSMLRDVNFFDPFNGWVVGDSGVIVHTSNGGSTWSEQTSGTTADLLSVVATAPGIAVATGLGNTILRTTDGGSTWTPRTSPVPDDWVAVSFLDADAGVASGKNGSIIRTADGGGSWDLLRQVSSLADIQYVDTDVIYAVGKLPGITSQWLMTTTDGGTTWGLRALTGWEVRSEAFALPGFGWLTGTGGVISTQDSGKTWTTHQPSMAAFNAVSMASPRVAFAVGDSGVVARMRTSGSIQGVLFRDANDDSLRNPGEDGIPGWTIHLDGPFSDSTTTGPDGLFSFSSLPHGSYRIRSEVKIFWEQTTPLLLDMDTLKIGDLSEYLIHPVIGLAGPFVRQRLPILVSDNSVIAHRYVWAGIRPGTTPGIWGVYPLASMADAMEGEAELPPRSFVEFGGIFDARFSDPDVPLNEPSEVFGEGSWTDMRPYTSPSQSDTFLLSFLPGYVHGGGYPMSIRWARDLVSKMFAGPVSLIDPFGNVTDMKTRDNVVINNGAVEFLILVTNSPIFPEAWLTSWRLVSLPAPVSDGRVTSLFPTAATAGYSFVPGVGYVKNDTLRPEIGYWLKYPPAIDSLNFDPAARLSDTLSLSAGWNLIGALSVPIPASSVRTVPQDLPLGFFFGYDDAYSAVDTLYPGMAYWVQSGAAGMLIMDAGPSGETGKVVSRAGNEAPPADFATVRIEDADSKVFDLHLTTDSSVDPSRYLLPPEPPAGAYDVRFGSGRFLEVVEDGSGSELQVMISSARFPLKVSIPGESSMQVSVIVDGRMVPVESGSGVTIARPSSLPGTGTPGQVVLTLAVPSANGLPTEFSLGQNYPNPFNPWTTIGYSVPVRSRVRIAIFDILGRKTEQLVDGVEEGGYHSVSWNAAGVATGIYFYRMEATGVDDPERSFLDIKKVVVMR